MDHSAEASAPSNRRIAVLAATALCLIAVLGIGARLAHTATIPNLGLPVSNSKSLAGVEAYNPQVDVTRRYLLALARLDYAGAYQLLAPSLRQEQSEAQFEQARRAEGVLGQPTVWADDRDSTRAQYALGTPSGQSELKRHRFILRQEGGRWWIDHETALPQDLSPAPSLTAAMNAYVWQRAGQVWTGSVELLRQQAFNGGQLLLFSYIEPHPEGILTAERLAVLNYYVDSRDGWLFEGGGNSGQPAGMGMADVALGFTAFGPDRRWIAYYGVVENTNTVSLAFREPNGAGHDLDVKGQRTVLLINERNPFDDRPFRQPFVSIVAKDVHGNTLRTNPTSPD